MSTRKNSSDSTSQNGVSFTAGSSSSAMQVKDVNYSQVVNNSQLIKNGAYNGHAVEIWADGAVFDTVSGTFLFPFRDFNPNDIRG